MVELNQIIPYVFPSKKGENSVPDVSHIEELMKLAGPKNRRKKMAPRVVAAVAGGAGIFWAVRVLGPEVSDLVPRFLEGQPPEVQVVGVGLTVAGVAMGLGSLSYRMFHRGIERRAVAVHLKSVQQISKMIVYVSGSGAIGFCKALERLGDQGAAKELMVFAHPPITAVKKGFIRMAGAVIAYAPVQFAMGSHKAAIAARKVEGENSHKAHGAFLKAIGGQEIGVEWSIFHMGTGHTSETCQTEWAKQRTATNAGAHPGRFVIVIRDASPPVDVPQGESMEEVLDDETKAAVSTVSPAVVRVASGSRRGSGVVIDPDGFVLTCAHVVDTFEEVTVGFSDGTVTEAEVTVLDKDTGVALVRCRGVEDVASVELGDSDSLNHGDFVAAFGYPENVVEGEEAKVTLGTVSGLVEDGSYTFIESNISVNPGNAGGPLVSMDGKFVGLVTQKSTDGQERTRALSSNDCNAALKKAISGSDVPVAAD